MYVSANLWGGLLRVGYQQQSVFGTAFLDSGDATYGPRVRYDYVIGPWTFIALWDKIEGTGYYAPGGPAAQHREQQPTRWIRMQTSMLAPLCTTGPRGMRVYSSTTTSLTIQPVPIMYPGYSGLTDATGFKRKFWVFDPYFKAQIGPVYLEGEVGYWTGKWQDPEAGVNRQLTRT